MIERKHYWDIESRRPCSSIYLLRVTKAKKVQNIHFAQYKPKDMGGAGAATGATSFCHSGAAFLMIWFRLRPSILWLFLLLEQKKFKIYILHKKPMDRGSETEPHDFSVLEPHQNDAVPAQAQAPAPTPYLLAYLGNKARKAQNLYFVQYKPKERGRTQSWSQSRIIFPRWSLIN
jgi:hypothetical protein